MAGVRAEHSGFMGLVVIGRTRETSSALVGLGLNVQHATGCRIMVLYNAQTRAMERTLNWVFLPLVEDRDWLLRRRCKVGSSVCEVRVARKKACKTATRERRDNDSMGKWLTRVGGSA